MSGLQVGVRCTTKDLNSGVGARGLIMTWTISRAGPARSTTNCSMDDFRVLIVEAVTSLSLASMHGLGDDSYA